MLSLKRGTSALSRFANITAQSSRSVGSRAGDASATKQVVSSDQKSLRTTVQTTLQGLERSLRAPATANMDRVLENLQFLHGMKVTVPLTYFMDTAAILCQRNDPVRTELLIHLCRDNCELTRTKGYDKRIRNDPVDKLVSFAIGGLLKNGTGEVGSQFWVRMTNNGFKSNRVVMEKMLDCINENASSTPSLEFVGSLHSAMRVHLWDQHAGYYGKILKVLRRHLESQCHNAEKMQLGLAKLEALWADAVKSVEVQNPAVAAFVRLPPELYAVRMSCYAVAMKTLRAARVSAEDPVLLRCRADAKKAFDAYLHSLTSLRPSESVSGDDSNIRDLVQEMRSILRAHLSPEDVAKIDKAGVRGAGPERNSAVTYLTVDEPQRDSRQAAGLYLTELAKQGSANEAAELLSAYISAWDSQAGAGQAAVVERIRAGERDWQARVACEVMRESRVVRPDSGGNAAYAQSVLQELLRTFEHIKRTVLQAHQLKPGAMFYASFIDAIAGNMFQLQLLRAEDKATGVVAWPEALAFVENFLSTCPESVRKSNSVRHSLVTLLCQSSGDASVDAQGVLRALEIVKRSDGVAPQTLCAVLEGATHSLDDSALCHVLAEVEGYADRHMRKVLYTGAKNDGADQTDLLRSRIFAHCRLREGYRALQLLRSWKNAGGKAEERVYRWIIHALHQATLDGDGEWGAAADPSRTVTFLMQEMERDGIAPSAEVLALLLRLYTKAVQVSSHDKEHQQQCLEKMDELVASYGGKANRRVVDEGVLRELVKARCAAGLVAEAQQLLTSAQKKYDIKPTARSYEPLIFQCAVLDGRLNAAEDMLMRLVNAAVPLTDAVVASFVAGLMRFGELSEALDTVQDMYNQHQVRPPATVWTALLDASLARGDVHEARRVVFLLKQLHTAEERAQLVGPVVCSVSTPAPTGAHSSAAASASSEGAAFLAKLAEARSSEERADAYQRRQKVLNEYWHPRAAKTKSGAPTALPAYLLKLGVPVGQQQRGALSDESLTLRFKAYNLALK